MPKKNEPGRLRWRLSELLEEEGFIVSAYDLKPAQGYWRSNPFVDVYRWEAYGKDSKGITTSFDSWNTMGDCVKYGIEVVRDGIGYLIELKTSKETGNEHS